MYKAGMCKIAAALLWCWASAANRMTVMCEQVSPLPAMHVQCAAITSPSNLQHTHRCEADSVCECSTVAF